MKKLLISVLSLGLCAVMLFGGCSCVGAPILSFNENFLGSATDKATKETLIYKVENVDSFGTEFKKDPSITSSVIEYSYNGTFEITWESIKSLPYPDDVNNPKPEEVSGLLGNVIPRNVIDVNAQNYYKLTSKLELTASYPTINGKVPEKPTCTDVIKTETYFANRIDSYAPIYTETVANYTNVVMVGGYAGVTFTEYSAYTEYKKESYIVHTKIDKETKFTSTEYAYSYRTAIDNAQILFLIRNIDFSKSNTVYIPTVSYQYGESQNLAFKKRTGSQVVYDNPAHAEFDSNASSTIKYNGNLLTANPDAKEIKISVDRIGFLVDSTTSAGIEQTVLVQNNAIDGLPNTALPMQYVEPLITLNTYQSLGVLSYTLTEIITSK